MPDEVRAETIDHRRKVLYRRANFCALLVLALSPFGGWRKFALFCIALSVTMTVVNRRLHRAVVGLPMSDTRLRLREVLAQQKAELVAEARGTPGWLRVVLVVGIVGLVMNVASR